MNQGSFGSFKKGGPLFSKEDVLERKKITEKERGWFWEKKKRKTKERAKGRKRLRGGV